ncbi:MFS transporter [Vibrio owensii]|uniref:Multidrug transporter n=1 Tax=Vibrio owensii CAIM 1854 = LMG 25443 TaxID=1229493 RepID=A0A0C1VW33_9VIBR|nr:MFS transporter [Vibrio owensii]KIF54263.1 multidrug transporter [Vibrio owensii CAIM 1854 = LMG 25443]
MNRSFHSGVLNVGHALNHYFLLIFPSVVLTLHKEWDMSYAELLQVGSGAMLVYGVMSLPAGWLADRWSRKGMMLVFYFGMGTSAFLTTLAQTPWQMGLGLCAIALFAAIYHPVGIALIFSSANKTGRAIAVNGLAGNLGLAFAAIGTALLCQWFSWQAAFYVPGLVCLLTGIVYWYASKGVTDIEHAKRRCDDVTMSLRQLKVLFACAAVVVFFGGLVFQSTTTSLPKIMDAQFSQSLSLSSTLTTSIFVCAAFIQLVVGELLDRVDIKKLLACIAGGQLLFLLLATVTHEWSLVLVFIGLMLCTYAQIPVNDWLIGRYSDVKWRSRIYAVKYTLSFSTGPIAYWLIAATYSHTQEFALMYFILAGGMGLASLSAMMMPSSRKHTEEQPDFAQ